MARIYPSRSRRRGALRSIMSLACMIGHSLGNLPEQTPWPIGPDNGWRYAFELAGNRIGNPLKIPWPGRRMPLRNFALEEGLLFANEADTFSCLQNPCRSGLLGSVVPCAFVVALADILRSPSGRTISCRTTKFNASVWHAFT